MDSLYPEFIQSIIDLSHGGVLTIDCKSDRNSATEKVFKRMGLDFNLQSQESHKHQVPEFQDQVKTLLRLLEFLYIGKFRSKMTMKECLDVSKLAFSLGVNNTANEIADICS